MKHRLILVAASIVCSSLLLLSCTGQPTPESTKTTTSQMPIQTAPPEPVVNPSPASLGPLKLLKTSPEKGPVGTAFTITGDGLPSGKPVDFVWVTYDGSFATDAGPENVLFLERKFISKRVPLGKATVNAQGQVTVNLVAPEDYGEIHDIYAVVDGQDVGKAGFRILRTVDLSPTEGPVGTPITITVKGIGWKPFENTMALRYDNKYTGFVSAVTTRGTVSFQVRAAGPVGKHVIQLTGASAATTYLNYVQSPVGYIPGDFSWTFTVTKDNGPLPLTLDWPDASRVIRLDNNAPRTTSTANQTSLDLLAVLEPASGPILSSTTLHASGLTPGREVELIWVTTRGNRLSPTGWSLTEIPLTKTTVAQDGSLTASIQVPDDLGGWHVVKLMQDGKVLKETPYYVERSLVTVMPTKVKVGETFGIQVKGIGWTELDNTLVVNYDNAYTGYACGFSSNGDITLNLIASGGPGTHLIDLYPTVYRAKGKVPHPEEFWNFELPQLTALQDHPGLTLGYKLPIFRLAIEIIP
ncbi:MAG: hypothetical protein HY530_08335 [Chloroflexi bacterium]|nr:hypothetical protein [Chloroflexota bacterium]